MFFLLLMKRFFIVNETFFPFRQGPSRSSKVQQGPAVRALAEKTAGDYCRLPLSTKSTAFLCPKGHKRCRIEPFPHGCKSGCNRNQDSKSLNVACDPCILFGRLVVCLMQIFPIRARGFVRAFSLTRFIFCTDCRDFSLLSVQIIPEEQNVKFTIIYIYIYSYTLYIGLCVTLSSSAVR